MRIIIVRHGEPDYVHDSLTEKGFREAQLLAKRLAPLDVKAYYCSPLGRAKDTAAPTLKAANRQAETLDWLQEFRGKIRKGLKVQGCWDRLPEEWCCDADFYDSEKWLDTKIMKSYNVKKEYKYVCNGVDALLEKHGYRKNGRAYDVINSNHDTIVLFCHFAVECVILSRILSVSPMPLWHNFVALPSSVTTLITEERREGTAIFRIQQFADISHLYSAGEKPSFAARYRECYGDKERK